MTRYFVVDSADGTKLGDFGLLTSAAERAAVFNDAEATTRRYQVHRVELNERGRVVSREWVGAGGKNGAIDVNDRVIRTDTPCIPGKVLAVAHDCALVIWGMDIGSGRKPQWEPLADLELDITADWYVAEKARQRSLGHCVRCRAALGASQYTPNGADMPTYCNVECYLDARGMDSQGRELATVTRVSREECERCRRGLPCMKHD